MRASSGTTSATSARSFHVIAMPAADAIASRWIVWFVEPPVACRPTIPLTMTRSSTTWPSGVKWSPPCTSDSTRCTEARVIASRSGVPGFTKVPPGGCRPISSISIWFVLAVP